MTTMHAAVVPRLAERSSYDVVTDLVAQGLFLRHARSHVHVSSHNDTCKSAIVPLAGGEWLHAEMFAESLERHHHLPVDRDRLGTSIICQPGFACLTCVCPC